MQAGPWATYSSFQVITPNDATRINCRAIYVGGAGNVAISPDGVTASTVFTAPPVGSIIPVELNEGRVLATGTTATPLIALS